VNIWVGKAGFATSDNIKDLRIKFHVNNSWIKEMEVSSADVKLQRYNGTAWQVLPTTIDSNTTGYSVFEADTPGFSPFAITAERPLPSIPNNDVKVLTTSVQMSPGENTAEKVRGLDNNHCFHPGGSPCSWI
jgi:hypothetical protein